MTVDTPHPPADALVLFGATGDLQYLRFRGGKMILEIARFLAERRPPTPCLVVDLEVVAESYRRLAEAFPLRHAKVMSAIHDMRRGRQNDARFGARTERVPAQQSGKCGDASFGRRRRVSEDGSVSPSGVAGSPSSNWRV